MPAAHYRPLRHGITNQKAPQAHEEEEAQEASEAHTLAAQNSRQVIPGHPAGWPVSF